MISGERKAGPRDRSWRASGQSQHISLPGPVLTGVTSSVLQGQSLAQGRSRGRRQALPGLRGVGPGVQDPPGHLFTL